MSLPIIAQYVPGDDFRHLDWKAYLRLNRLILKLFEEEEDLPIYFFVDSSQSMNYGQPTKARLRPPSRCRLCYIGLANLDRVNVISFADGVKSELPPQRGKGRIFKIFEFLDDIAARRRNRCANIVQNLLYRDHGAAVWQS